MLYLLRFAALKLVSTLLPHGYVIRACGEFVLTLLGRHGKSDYFSALIEAFGMSISSTARRQFVLLLLRLQLYFFRLLIDGWVVECVLGYSFYLCTAI